MDFLHQKVAVLSSAADDASALLRRALKLSATDPVDCIELHF